MYNILSFLFPSSWQVKEWDFHGDACERSPKYKETENYKRLINTLKIILILMISNSRIKNKFCHLVRDTIVLSTFGYILIYILLINVV